MKIAIQDANILIDLMDCGIFDAFFELGIETHTTSLVLSEIKKASQSSYCSGAIEKGLLQVKRIETLEIMEIQSRLKGGLSPADWSVMEMAQEHNAILLTGDGALRRNATRRKIEVKGILWIFDELVQSEIIEAPLAAEKLIGLKARNPRLPTDEVNNRIEKWSSAT